MIKDAIEKVTKEHRLFWQSIPDLWCPFCEKETFQVGRWRWLEIGVKEFKEKIIKCNKCNSIQTYKYQKIKNKFDLIEITFSKGQRND